MTGPAHLSPVTAVHVALSWMTVLPMPQPTAPMDRRTGGATIAAVPVSGILLGGIAAATAFGLAQTALPSTLIGFLIVALLGLLTRGMHLDGLADTADGLGCYGSPERISEVMRSGTVGPFAVATLVLSLALQGVGFAALVDQSRWYEIGFVIALARLAAVIGCRRNLDAVHRDGFGPLVAGTQKWSILGWTAAFLAAAIAGAALSIAAWSGVAVTIVVAGCGWLFTRHCARRMGGITGDALGASFELSVVLALVGLLL